MLNVQNVIQSRNEEGEKGGKVENNAPQFRGRRQVQARVLAINETMENGKGVESLNKAAVVTFRRALLRNRVRGRQSARDICSAHFFLLGVRDN